MEAIDEMASLTSPPSSPRHAFTMEVEESPLGEVRAAIPFLWELVPGTARDDFEMVFVDVGVFSEEAGSEEQGSLRSSDDFESLSCGVEFCTPIGELGAVSMSPAREGPPLRLPPRLQAVKHLRTPESSCSESRHSPHSPHSPLTSRLALCGFMRMPESEVTILGMQERKQRLRSLSPLRFLTIDRSSGSNLSSETYFSRDSVSSASSFSSSSSETAVDSPPALWDKGRTLNDLVPDMAPASGGAEGLKVAHPRMVQSGRELLQQRQKTAEKIDVIPQLSPPHTKSRSSPSVDMPFRISRRERLGRVLFGSRFEVIGSCLGIPPESP